MICYPRGGLISSQRSRPLMPRATRSQSQLNEGIANFYDESTGLWEDMWGEHLHHGYYPSQGPRPASNTAAQIDMIERVLDWADVDSSSVSSVIDVGCGLGGSSRHLSRKYGCRAKGVTLSPFQAERGNQLSASAGLGDKVGLQVADALNMPFPDSSFDLAWSLESGEHMPDKARFVNELARVTMPRGKVVIVTWCHRVLAPGELTLKFHERKLLEAICAAYYLPPWCSIADYERLFKEEGLVHVKTADWSNEVAPFWGEVMKSALTGTGVAGLFKAGWTTMKGALVMPLMALGFQLGLIKFVLITGQKE